MPSTPCLSASGGCHARDRAVRRRSRPPRWRFGFGRPAACCHGVTLDIPAGTTVAIVGPTGSGKSTLANLALRLLDPDTGTFTLDGIELRELAAG